jgi:hypothetical protein
MADEAESDGDDEPIVELGEKTPVAGQPLARVAARLTWPHEVSRIINQEGESMIRTPSGPQQVESIFADIDETYIDSRQTFVYRHLSRLLRMLSGAVLLRLKVMMRMAMMTAIIQTFVSLVEDVIGSGPVAAEGDDANGNDDGNNTTNTDGDVDPEAEAI